MKFLLVILPLSILLTSCASYFKRKTCESTNWYEHGKKVALSGKRLDADTLFNECKKVEADIRWDEVDLGFKSGMKDYCKPKTAYSTGRKGEFFNEDFCEPHLVKKLKKQHSKGVNAFCQPKVAFKYGAGGGVYNNICPKSMEESFLARFNKGRKRYLSGQIQDKSEQIHQITNQVNNKLSQKNSLLYQLNLIPNTKVYVQRRVYDPVTKRYITKSELKEDAGRVTQRRKINNQLTTLNSSISSLQAKQESLRNEIRDHKKELRSIE